jgi:type III secretion system FlhB-like substrate exporter
MFFLLLKTKKRRSKEWHVVAESGDGVVADQIIGRARASQLAADSTTTRTKNLASPRLP